MNRLIVLFKALVKRGKSFFTKIIVLGVGLALGLVLIAKVFLEQTYDDFFPDANRIYQIQTTVLRDNDDNGLKEYSQVSGGVAPGMKAEIPEVEAATRFTHISWDGTVVTPDLKKYKAHTILADTSFFDVLPRPVLVGNYKDVMSRPMYVMISRKMAEKMGGISTVAGKTFQIDRYPDKVLTIGGVFEDVPENSHLSYDVLVSMPSVSQFTWDGTENWLGNDRYKAYVKLYPGVKPESLAQAVRRMQEKHQPMEELRKAGVDLTYTFLPLLDLHKGKPEVKRMFVLLSLLAFALLFTAVMNYILIVISSLVNRSKEMAVNKCYGASEGDIYRKMLSETLTHLIAAVLLAVVLIFVFQSQIEDLLSTTLTVLFSWRACLLVFGVCMIVFFISGLVPGYLYSHVPIATAFRNYNENKRYWKFALLFVQFMATGFLVTLLVVIGRQYDHMVTDNPGYTYENLAYVPLLGIDAEARGKVQEEVGRLPEVAAVTTCSQLPIGWASGNNVFLPGDDRELFNVADFYSVGNDYFNLMEIPVVEGRSFTENIPSSNEVMVSRHFVEKMMLVADWPDGAVGKAIGITEHSQDRTQTFTICGVYENFRIGAIGSEDTRASVMFYSQRPSNILLIKYHRQTAEANQRVNDLITSIVPPTKEIVVYSYPAEMIHLYTSSRKFRDSLLLGGLVALVIAVIGLIGYTNDEMNRRRKETAIRKVNGATIFNILSLFLKDIFRMAFPALLFGCGIAAFVATKWQAQFSEKASLPLFLYLLCGMFVLVVILAAVSINSYRSAIENPADIVKSE